MANETPLLEWALKHHEEIQLEIFPIQSCVKLMPGFADMYVELKSPSGKSCGRGSSELGEDHALQVAISEAIERTVLLGRTKISRATIWGSATRTCPHDAATLAKYEALERWHLTQHLKKSIPLRPIQSEELGSLNGLTLWLQLFTKMEKELRLYIYHIKPRGTTIIAELHSSVPSPEIFIGAAHHVDPSQALSKAIEEVARDLPRQTIRHGVTPKSLNRQTKYQAFLSTSPSQSPKINLRIDPIKIGSLRPPLVLARAEIHGHFVCDQTKKLWCTHGFH